MNRVTDLQSPLHSIEYASFMPNDYVWKINEFKNLQGLIV